jgi:hypothetical protein
MVLDYGPYGVVRDVHVFVPENVPNGRDLGPSFS